MKTEKKNYIAEIDVVDGGFSHFSFSTTPETSFVAALRIAKNLHTAWYCANIYRKSRNGEYVFIGRVNNNASFSVATDEEKKVMLLSVVDIATATKAEFSL